MTMTRRRRPDVTWLVCGPDPHFATCERCGHHEPPPDLPMPLKAAAMYMRYLVEKHRHCPPRNLFSPERHE